MAESIDKLLEHHWALDEAAAEVVAERIESFSEGPGHIEDVVAGLPDEAVQARDRNRENIGRIFTEHPTDRFIAIGPCSLDVDVDYEPLYDYIDELQEAHPGAVIALRANGAKPRTSTGWTGLWYGLDLEYRERLFGVYQEAFNRGIPLITEVTEGNQLGALAPFLSAAWVGARDIEATSHRGKFAAYHLPVGVKNGVTGDLDILDNTIKAIRSGSEANDGSGVDLGTVASTPDFVGLPTGVVPVGKGNERVAIFGRGYELPENMSPEERRQAAFDYISRLDHLGSLRGCSVVIDGTHSVPPMFSINKKNPDRLIPVLEEIHKGIISGEIEQADQIVGVMAEVGIVEGRTDPNYVLDGPRKAQLRELIGVTLHLLTPEEK